MAPSDEPTRLDNGALPLYDANVRIMPDGTIHLQRGRWKAAID